MIGVYFGLLFENILNDEKLDVDDLARQLNVLFADGLVERDQRHRGIGHIPVAAKNFSIRIGAAPRGPSRQPTGERREHLLAAAREGFSTRGLDGAIDVHVARGLVGPPPQVHQSGGATTVTK